MYKIDNIIKIKYESQLILSKSISILVYLPRIPRTVFGLASYLMHSKINKIPNIYE